MKVHHLTTRVEELDILNHPEVVEFLKQFNANISIEHDKKVEDNEISEQ
jgi:hypothetical protein